MEVYQCIRSRRTIREFKPDPIPEDLVRRILQAARWAPSSSNTQCWHFIVIQDRETLSSLSCICSQGRFVGDAPLAIAITMENAPRPQLDAGRALQQMELMAWSEGVGTCFVGVRDPEQQKAVKELLGIPEEFELITILPFGYRTDGPRAKGTPRKPLEEIVHWEWYSQNTQAG
jgi:nitroreductase